MFIRGRIQEAVSQDLLKQVFKFMPGCD